MGGGRGGVVEGRKEERTGVEGIIFFVGCFFMPFRSRGQISRRQGGTVVGGGEGGARGGGGGGGVYVYPG